MIECPYCHQRYGAYDLGREFLEEDEWDDGPCRDYKCVCKKCGRAFLVTDYFEYCDSDCSPLKE